MSLYTGIKLMIVVITGMFAIGAFLEAVERDFQPPRRTQILLFMTGFLGMLAITWLMFSEPWYEAIWLKLASSVIFGYFWAFTMSERWRFIRDRMKKKD
jgi:fluoride ion exporter CrcB/FEX